MLLQLADIDVSTVECILIRRRYLDERATFMCLYVSKEAPFYTIPFSYEEMFRFGLLFTLYRFPIRHQMKTVA